VRDLFEPEVELWYAVKRDQFFFYYPGDFFNPQFIMTPNGRRWILESPYRQPRKYKPYIKRIEKSFCKLEDLK